MLSAEKIQLNWERYLTEIKNNISEERSSILLPFLKKYEERMMMMPAFLDIWHQYLYQIHYCSLYHLLIRYPYPRHLGLPVLFYYELPENSTSIYKFVGELNNAEFVMEYK